MTFARPILIGVGVLGLLLGAAVLVSKQSPVQIVGVGLWMLGAILLHDAVLSPFVLGVSVLVRRAGRRPATASASHSAQSRRTWRGVLLIIQGGVIVGAILTLVVVPEIYAKTLGTANPTVLPSDYALRLSVMWVVIAGVTALASVVYAWRLAKNSPRD